MQFALQGQINIFLQKGNRKEIELVVRPGGRHPVTVLRPHQEDVARVGLQVVDGVSLAVGLIRYGHYY